MSKQNPEHAKTDSSAMKGKDTGKERQESGYTNRWGVQGVECFYQMDPTIFGKHGIFYE